MTLSERDLDLLEFLYRMRYGFVRQIKRRFFAQLSQKACEKAMRKLRRLGLIERKQLPRNIDRPIGDLWYLSREGTSVLSSFRRRDLTFQNIGRGFTILPQARHRMRMIDFRMMMEDGIEEMPLVVKQELVDDRKVKRAGRRMSPAALSVADGPVFIVPDLIYILKSRITGQERVYMIEIDCGTENLVGRDRTTVMDKLLRYETLLCDGGAPWRRYLDTDARAFEVVFVTESTLRIRHLLKLVHKQLRYPEYFLASTHRLIWERGAFAHVWHRGDGTKDQPLIGS